MVMNLKSQDGGSVEEATRQQNWDRGLSVMNVAGPDRLEQRRNPIGSDSCGIPIADLSFMVTFNCSSRERSFRTVLCAATFEKVFSFRGASSPVKNFLKNLSG